jgi:hypothetical protein
MSKIPSVPADGSQVKVSASEPGCFTCCEPLVVPFADDLSVHDLLFVPSRDVSPILQGGHHLIEGGAALADACVPEPPPKVAPAHRAAEEIRNDKELQVGSIVPHIVSPDRRLPHPPVHLLVFW